LPKKLDTSSLRGLIPLPKYDFGKLVNGHFVDESFFTILEEKEFVNNTMV
jgi:hypothetical protein